MVIRRKAKLTREQVDSIRDRYTAEYGQIAAFAAEFNVHEGTDRNALSGKSWSGETTATLISEATIHKNVIKYLQLNTRNDVRYFHVANERIGNYGAMAHFKALGVSPGVPDIILVKGQTVYWMELKARNGKLSDNQKSWLDFLAGNGHKVAVCFGFDEAVEVFNLWGVLKSNMNQAA